MNFGGFVFGTHANVGKFLETEAGSHESSFGILPELVEVRDARPNPVGRDVEIVDGLEKVAQQTMDDRCRTRLGFDGIEVRNGLQAVLHLTRIEHFDIHVFSNNLYFLAPPQSPDQILLYRYRTVLQ